MIYQMLKFFKKNSFIFSPEMILIPLFCFEARLTRHNLHVLVLTDCGTRGTKGEYSSKPPKHSIVKRILVF